jgi:hypothetical protein
LKYLAHTTAALAAVLVWGCAPVAEPIVAPVPQGAAGDSAPRPLVLPVTPPLEFQQAVQRGTRTATGQPGPRYWQQRVRYSIEAELDPASERLTGRERLVYHNRSPDTLPYVVFNLYQNLFRGGQFNTGGLTLTRLAAQGQNLRQFSQAETDVIRGGGQASPGYFVIGTLGRVYLPRALAPGDSAVFEIEWNFRVPQTGAPRTAYEDVLGGRVFQVAQWYPQIAVYDDVVGYDVTPYTGQGEFYLDYGDFDFAVTVPAGWLVAGTGTLTNADQVLAPAVRQRLERALQSDEIVRVVTQAELGEATQAGQNGKVTWRFQARDVRDVAFATSNRYLWDATRGTIPAPGGGTRTVGVHAFYRPGAPHWENAARYADHSIEFLSRTIVPYIYPHITTTEGPVYGMEYPMLIFVGRPDAEEELYEVTAHEVGHEWFPMMVGQDEALAAWMDEGVNTYFERLAVADFIRPPDAFLQPRSTYLMVAGRKGTEAPLMRSADTYTDLQLGVAGYYKPGILMRGLRAVVGDSVFVRAIRTYSNEWQLKHPYPYDFFDTVERVAGRDLDWFWYPWFFTTATHDLSIASVTPGSGSVTVTVRDIGQVPGPAFLAVTTSEGRTVRETVPIERFLGPPGTRAMTVTIPVSGTVTRVVIDPEQFLPDINPRNNVWTPR